MNDNDFYPDAYCPVGQRHDEAHLGHYKKRISMIDGLCDNTFQALFMFEGHCNTATFEVYIEYVLVPTLKSGMTVIIDNASFHKSLSIKKLIEAAGCQLIYLPPYSPDLNPIEHYFYKLYPVNRRAGCPTYLSNRYLEPYKTPVIWGVSPWNFHTTITIKKRQHLH